MGRIKRSLERPSPMLAVVEDKERGLAFDAEATLESDYGVFRPGGREDLWRAEGLVVRQPSGVALDDKEPTVSAWGMDSGFLGGRFDLVVWDDLVDRKNTATVEARDKLAEWYFTEAETRLEARWALSYCKVNGLQLTTSIELHLTRFGMTVVLSTPTLSTRPTMRVSATTSTEDELSRGLRDAC